MKKTDMELQAIREKLRRLETEPTHTGDVLNMPWSSPQQAQISSAAQLTNPPVRRPSKQTVNHTPQAAAMATLRQRSTTQPNRSAEEAVDNTAIAESTHASKAHQLVMQEIERLEIHARNLNERSQQQAHEILAMKRSAQQAAVALRRQGIHQHPQLDTIAKFLDEYPSAMLPHIERDSQGRFTLSHTTVDLNYAEQEAQHTAQTLRNLGGHHHNQNHHSQNSALHNRENLAHSQPFSAPVTAGPSMNEYIENSSTEQLAAEQVDTERSAEPKTRTRRDRSHQRSRHSWGAGVMALFGHLNKRQRSAFNQQILASSVATTEGATTGIASPALIDREENASAYDRHKAKRFSWMDGAIWFSAAAIARIILEAIVISYPITRMPLMIVLFSVISFSIYRVFVSKSSDPTPAYRLGIVLLGLFIGSSF